jgi:hypothetical protein
MENIRVFSKLFLILVLSFELGAIFMNLEKGHSAFYLFYSFHKSGFDALLSLSYWMLIYWGLICLGLLLFGLSVIRSENLPPIEMTRSLRDFLDQKGKSFSEYKYDESLQHQYSKFLNPRTDKEADYWVKEKLKKPHRQLVFFSVLYFLYPLFFLWRLGLEIIFCRDCLGISHKLGDLRCSKMAIQKSLP